MIEVLYEDDECIVVNKPEKLLTVPSRESTEKVSLLSLLKKQIDLYLYPIHRLDRATSGIVIFGKSKKFVTKIKDIWHTDQVKKYYLGVVEAINLQADEYSFPLKSEKGDYQEARTVFHPLQHFKTCTYIEIQIFTGRRHQIRRHFNRRMQHIIGDRRYGKKKMNNYYLDNFGLDRMFLHSHRFEFYHPIKNINVLVECSLPEELGLFLNNIN